MERDSEKSPEFDSMKPEQEEAALALAKGLRVAAVSATLCIADTTIYRWLREVPAFRARIHEIRRAAIMAASGKLKEEFDRSIEMLMELRGQAHSNQDNRFLLIIIRTHADLLASLNSTEELERRVADLEAGYRRQAVQP